MPGSLVKITETTVSSGVSSVTLTGIDSTYDVYKFVFSGLEVCLLYTSPSPRDGLLSRMPSSA